MSPNRIVARHRSWLLPLFVSITAWAAVVIVAAMQGKRDYSVTTGAITMALLCAMILGLVASVRNARGIWRRWRWLRHDDRVERGREAEVAAAWEKARSLAAGLAAGKPLASLAVPDLALQSGEIAYLDVRVKCTLIAPGQPVLSGHRVVCTAKRICVESEGGWQSYSHREVTAVSAAELRLTHTLYFASSAQLMITGIDAPVVATYVIWILTIHALGH